MLRLCLTLTCCNSRCQVAFHTGIDRQALESINNTLCSSLKVPLEYSVAQAGLKYALTSGNQGCTVKRTSPRKKKVVDAYKQTNMMGQRAGWTAPLWPADLAYLSTMGQSRFHRPLA
ncbi:hypothetical protein H112_00112 [Trichophyton rubrum D6]|uniref:Uncharacterized protein n=3 Tax=Trichophyton TaxID=5550 RepID=A0A080WJY1_TRIRC|nr:uncharacterized protein TERG_12711 [Trichophyton rubrum CBS 118892]EZF28017.1 hypothetical protein H100_00111 [Trichophyton rubrum MR850]EZF47044.1 hypothetical protein H102_00110 [Trichophyton rubrum CBS 100081]EZF57699.1 hypothetical protein H103_00112 [Trichophyton rubrum CBS 288.86]EZF68303.1 hypothetical protein H104_00110 [Trichophyton rubrum CBS 289.86]EZF78973.1 hypothetical protein H105_00102 [Trichophyton soudanense CBS 452.61]EZF89619.1 hypothetical protein H110_00112 [Trichophy